MSRHADKGRLCEHRLYKFHCPVKERKYERSERNGKSSQLFYIIVEYNVEGERARCHQNQENNEQRAKETCRRVKGIDNDG